MKNCRTQRRTKTCERGRATILGNPDVTVTCQIRDFSESGLCIIVDQSVSSGTIVKVDWANNFLIGRAQSVRGSRAAGFRVGLELLYCSRWTDSIAAILEAAHGDSLVRLAS